MFGAAPACLSLPAARLAAETTGPAAPVFFLFDYLDMIWLPLSVDPGPLNARLAGRLAGC